MAPGGLGAAGALARGAGALRGPAGRGARGLAGGGGPAAGSGGEVARPYRPAPPHSFTVVHKNGLDILHDPWYNKGSAFSMFERNLLALRGLLPPCPKPFDLQKRKVLDEYYHGIAEVAPGDEIVTEDSIRRWRVLQNLKDRNETLYYRILKDNLEEMCPIVYTPTVGWACQNFSTTYNRPHGMFFSTSDRGNMATMVHNWPAHEVDAIVVTDGSRILGLGDLGVNGLGISMGKLDMYVAGGGFHPDRVMPVVLDVGTNNMELLRDPRYIGLRQERLSGKAYLDIVDEFVSAVTSRWPKVLIQFEDFHSGVANALLERYRYTHLVFNDDIQGTAATVLGGVYGALSLRDKSPADITQQTFVFAGAGSAGMGVVGALAQAMQRHGLSAEESAARFWIVDKDGLVTRERAGYQLEGEVGNFARQGEGANMEGASLLDVIRHAKPTVLIGLSAVRNLFKKEELRALADNAERPLVMALSNPTQRLECTVEQAVEFTEGRCIYASGSPQKHFTYNGRTFRASQANNVYIFPGLALGAVLSGARYISDSMVMAAAEELPKHITPDCQAEGAIYPLLGDMDSISAHIALAVIKQARSEGCCRGDVMEVLNDEEELFRWVRANMFQPNYSKYVYRPPGIEE